METVKKLKKKKTYRFFYHYYRQYDKMSVHFRGKCFRAKNVECKVPCETHWKKTQPNLSMRGYAEEIVEKVDKIIIR